MIVEEEFNNKNQLNKILKKVNTIQGKAIIDTQNKTISAKFNATMTGGYMPNDGFTQKQLEQLGQVVELVVDAKIKPINDRLDLIEQDIKVLKEDMVEVKTRLNVVEKDIKAIKNCPTIQKEIKED